METLNVFFEQTRVGSIRIDSRRFFSFKYSREWLDSPEAFRISISMPLQEGIFQHDTVKSFFSNLLPESAVRKLISKQLGISDKNGFMLLKRIGGECAGAISILPDSEKPESPDQYQYRSLSDGQLSDLIMQISRLPLLAGQDGIRVSLAGSVGLKISPVSIVRAKSQKVLLIKRYDRNPDNDVTRRIHQEDLCQAMGLSHEMKYEADGGPGLKACFDLTRAYSANPIKYLQQLMEWVFFNFLIGNMDAHAKNLSWIDQ